MMAKSVNLYRAKTHLSDLVEAGCERRRDRDREGRQADGAAGGAAEGEAIVSVRPEPDGRDVTFLSG